MKLHNFSPDFYQPILKEIDDRPFVFLRNPGNYGDSLIRHGSLVFFEKNKLDYIFLKDEPEMVLKKINDFKNDKKYKTFVFGGGGAWLEFYFSQMIRFVEKGLEIFDKVIVLPSTFERHEKLDKFLNQVDKSKITFFRRDDFISKEAIPHAILVPDMALCTENVDIKTKVEHQKGYFFRSDIEASNKIDIPANNFNLSGHGNDMTDINFFFNYLNKYEELITDRLHVCIAGYLLGKKVNFYNNSYDKNKSFYNTFFKDKENIKFFDLN